MSSQPLKPAQIIQGADFGCPIREFHVHADGDVVFQAPDNSFVQISYGLLNALQAAGRAARKDRADLEPTAA